MLAYRVAGTWRGACARSKIYIPLLDPINENPAPAASTFTSRIHSTHATRFGSVRPRPGVPRSRVGMCA